MDSSNFDPKNESDRRVGMKSNSGETVKNGAKEIQSVILEANKIITRKNILMAGWFYA